MNTDRHRLLRPLCFLLLFAQAGTSTAQVVVRPVKRVKSEPKTDGSHFVSEQVKLSNGRYGNTVCSNYAIDGAGRRLSADQRSGCVGLGLGPSSAGFYRKGAGFLRVAINGKRFVPSAPATVQTFGGGKRGGVRLVWESSEARLTATLVLRDGIDALLAQYAVETKAEPVDRMGMEFRTYPYYFAGGGRDTERVLTTAARRVTGPTRPDGEAVELRLRLPDERWVCLSDRRLKIGGPAGMAFAPDDVADVRVAITHHCVPIRITLPEGRSTCRVVMWEPQALDHEGAVAIARSLLSRALSALEAEDFDTSQRVHIAEPASVRLEQAGVAYGMDDVILENRLLRVRITPANGARVKQFVFKPTGKNLAAYSPKVGGLFADISPAQDFSAAMLTSPYDYQIVERGPERVSVKTWWSAASGPLRGIRFVKEYVLESGSAALRVKQAMVNTGLARTRADWRQQHIVSFDGRFDPTVHWPLAPSPEGVVKRDKMKFYRDFVDRWMAVVDTRRRTGIVTLLNYHQLDQELFWLQPKLGNSTVEWLYAPTTLGPNERWSTEARTATFVGLDSVSLACEDFVGYLEVDGGRCRLRLFGLEKGRWQVSGVAHPKGWELDEKLVELGAGEVATATWPAGEEPTTWASMLFAQDGEKREFRVRLAALDQAPNFRIKPPEKKPPAVVKDRPAEKVAIKPTDARQGPSIRVLSIAAEGEATDFAYRGFRGRDRVRYFLAERSEFKVDCAQEATFLSYLPKLYTYDVLVLDGAPGYLFEPYVADLRKYVESGRGLVLIGGPLSYGGSDPDLPNWDCLGPVLPVQILARPDYVGQEPKLDGEPVQLSRRDYVRVTHPDGKEPYVVPVGEMPARPTHAWLAQGVTAMVAADGDALCQRISLSSLAPSYNRVAALPGSRVLATVGPDPLVVTHKQGEGRVVAFTGGDLRQLYVWPQTAELFARMIGWASGRSVTPRQPAGVIPTPVGIRLNFHRKRTWLRGDRAPFTVERRIDGRGGLRVTVRLIDPRYEEVLAQDLTISAGEASVEGSLDLAGLAYGAYRVEATATPDCRAVDRIFVAPPIQIDFPVFYYGCTMHKHQGTSCQSLGMVDLLAEQTNVMFSGRLSPPNADVRELLDFCGERGLGVFFWNRTLTRMGPEPRDWRVRVQRHPEKVRAALSQVIEIMKDYDRYPAAFAWYLDDEGNSFSFGEYDRGLFRRKYGMEMGVPEDITRWPKQKRATYEPLNPPAPTSEDQFRWRLNLANYQAESVDILFSGVAKELRRRYPHLIITSLFTFSSPGQYGVFMDRVFRPLDNLLADVYPAGVHQIAQCQALYSVLRSAAARQKKPWWVMAATWRNNPAGARMQYWMALGSAVRSLSWYSTLDTFKTGMWEPMAAYNKKLLEYEPLLARWEKPASKIAVLYADAEVARTSYADHHRGLYHVFTELYAQDLYADTVTEAQIRDGSVDRYDVVILPRNLQLERDVVAGLIECACRKPVYLGPETLVAIPGARPFDASEIRKRVEPMFVSPNRKVFVEPLVSGDLAYTVVYNHNPVPMRETVTSSALAPAAVYDMWAGKELSLDGRTATVELAPYDGKMLAWLPFRPNRLNVDVSGECAPSSGGRVAVRQLAQAQRPGLLPVSVDVFDPNGAQVRGYSRKDVLRAGTLDMRIPFAKNDTCGKWRIQVVDLVTRETVERELLLQAP